MVKTLQQTAELSLADELSPFWTHVLSWSADNLGHFPVETAVKRPDERRTC